MAEIKLLDLATGKEKSKVSAPDEIFSQALRTDLLNDYVIMQHRAARQGTHCTKTRAEVAGTGKKPFRQKGTGNARQGTLIGPHQYGGGVAFGPKPRNYKSKLTRKTKVLANQVALSQKRFEGSLYVCESLDIKSGKTRDAVKLIKGMNAKNVLFIGNFSDETLRAFRNIDTGKLLSPDLLNVKDVLFFEKCVMTRDAFEWIQRHLTIDSKTEEKAA